MSELVKELLFGKECEKSLMVGVDTVCKAVSASIGPFGRTILIETPEQTKSITATKDGATIAKNITILNPVANMACRVVKEGAEKTATDSGDGTSACCVLSQALIKGGHEKIKNGINKTQVLRYMEEVVGEVVEILKEKSIPCDETTILDVATISANNDDVLGKIIADTYKEVGVNGIVTVEKSLTHETTYEVVSGLKVDRSYTSPKFVNNVEKEEWMAEKVHILMCDREISSHDQIKSILDVIIATKRKLLIIAPCTTGFLNFMVHNYLNNVLDLCIIQPPNFGYKLQEEMEDIAVSIGGKYFSQQIGDDLSLIRFEDLGFAEKVIVGRKQTVIVNGHGDKELVDKRANELKSTLENRTLKHEKEFILKRIASLIGGIGVIYVGGLTDLIQKETIDRCDDATLAVKSAMEEGIVSGAGKALWEIEIPLKKNMPKEYAIALDIVMGAIKVPLRQILENADLDVNKIYPTKISSNWFFRLLGIKNKPVSIMEGWGYNLKTEHYGNLVSLGVVDATKVVRTALQNANSVATTILSTSVSINIQRA